MLAEIQRKREEKSQFYLLDYALYFRCDTTCIGCAFCAHHIKGRTVSKCSSLLCGALVNGHTGGHSRHTSYTTKHHHCGTPPQRSLSTVIDAGTKRLIVRFQPYYQLGDHTF
jgi:hypothetical protein